jgi:hypothetical protein
MASRRRMTVTPSAARLTESLRDIGYDFTAALADLVDNSIAAGATRVEVVIEFDGADSRVFLIDDGSGMTENALCEAMRFGSRRTYVENDLGRYGLGLKTASLSQCRRLTVATRHSPSYRRISARCLDLDIIQDCDNWVVIQPWDDESTERANRWLSDGPGTVVIWERLDRVLPEKRPEGGWARRRIEALKDATVEHLAMVFHRYIEGLPDGRRVAILVNGEKVAPWNPFAPSEPGTIELPAQRFEIAVGETGGDVRLRRFVLPSRDSFSSADEFERLSGPRKWNRQQGLYIYRADRLVQWGGWAGLRGIDEHTKLARAALDFDTALDPLFNINVSKMRVSLPAQLRQMLDRPVHEVCIAAENAYRKTRRGGGSCAPAPPAAEAPASIVGLALTAAAIQAGEWDALQRILAVLHEHEPGIAAGLIG